MEAERQFRRRILLVDNDTHFLRRCSAMLRKHAYEVVTANDGFVALLALRTGHPDVLITELDLPRMSGFELLSIVRTRFPQVAVISISGEYTPATVPHEALCDTFLAKATNFEFEVLEEVRRLIAESPLRASRAKSDLAPVWIPRSTTGYIVLTCPECLRSFSALQPRPGASTEVCVCCGASVPFEMSSVEVAPAKPPLSSELRSRSVREKSRELRAESHSLRGKSRS